MTREDIISMAREADIDCDTDGDIWGSTNGALLRFAALVAAEKEKQMVNILERLQERSGESHNYYGHAIRVIKGEI